MQYMSDKIIDQINEEAKRKRDEQSSTIDEDGQEQFDQHLMSKAKSKVSEGVRKKFGCNRCVCINQEKVRNKAAIMILTELISDEIRRTERKRRGRIDTSCLKRSYNRKKYSHRRTLISILLAPILVYYYLFLAFSSDAPQLALCSSFEDPQDAGVALQLPEYSPTRKPQKVGNLTPTPTQDPPQAQPVPTSVDIERQQHQHHHHHHHHHHQQQQQQQQQRHLEQPRQQSQQRAQQQQTHQFQHQQQHPERQVERQQQVPSEASSIVNKKRAEKLSVSHNELDIFLDDMNHNELRAVANGQPIADLFQEKHLKSITEEQAVGSGQDVPLVGSHSEQQIYTECALILQRTYVKNIDSPKHQLVPFGKTEQSCISYKHIDKAFAKAKKLLKFNELAKQQSKKLMGGRLRAPLDVIHKSLEPPEDLIAAIGELNMATTQIIADQFELSNDELLNGLPLIDMSRTKFWPLCPLLVRQNLECQVTRFRTLTGHCNNLKHPTWGAAMSPFARYLPPVHPDGIWIPRKSIVSEVTFELVPGHRELHASVSPSARVPIYSPGQRITREDSASPAEEREEDRAAASRQKAWRQAGERRGAVDELVDEAGSMVRGQRLARPLSSMASELPSARLVSSTVHRDLDLANHDLSILFMSWGQLLDHDMTRAAQPPATIKCCPQEGEVEPKHKLCLPISVPEKDPFYSKFGVRCLEFRRSLAGLRPNCVLGPRVHQNAITAPIDANFVYGSSQAQADSLRTFKGGRLRSRDWFAKERLKPILPAQESEPDQDCLGRPEGLFCFRAGDVRVNEQIHLTVLHTLYMREHNRLAAHLEDLNPDWDDERLYQETRHIVAATVQHVMLNEYLPLLIGPKMAQLYNLTAHESSRFPAQSHPRGAHAHWPGYDPSVTTSVSNSFAAAAFRQGHTFIQGTVERYSKFHEHLASDRLRDLLKRPFIVYQPGVLDQLTGGLINQPSQGYDPFISEDVSGHLFQEPRAQFGHDLPAINLQRGREQGLPGYNLFREWCGLPRAESFAQLEPYLSNHTAYLYSRLYRHVDDIDLWSGGISERRLPGAAIGPTFACIIARQFSNTRRGDRFWYENAGFPSSFSGQQLAQLRRVSLAKILCENSDDLPTIQRWPLRMPHPVLNPRVPCSQLPKLDLNFWQERPLS